MRAAYDELLPPIFRMDLGNFSRTATQNIGKFGSLFNFVNSVT
jgi:hypothetical protein